ncbi:MAG: GNAT family N-acetyltransferase [Rhodospirillaceae bacterium]
MPRGGRARVILRPAEAADSPRCADIFLAGRRAACPGRPPDRFRLQDYYASVVGEEVWVAEAGGDVVGFISAALPDNVIQNLFVDAGWRNRGIGRDLLNCALSHLGRVVHLRCSARNHAARGFYRRNGWVEIESEANGDTVLYRKIICLRA